MARRYRHSIGMNSSLRFSFFAASCLAGLVFMACSSSSEETPNPGNETGGEPSISLGGDGNTTSSGGDSSSSTGGTGGAGYVDPISGLAYGDTECSDGIDNDDNGLIDGLDPECTGPLDDDESSFATGIPGDNKDPKQDCFFDGNSGAGDDDCDSTKETQSQQCIDYCGSRVPNGCDCFGCCDVFDGTDTYSVKLTGSCADITDVSDPEKCEACEASVDCGNTCGECELCPGKTLADLPESCGTTGTGGGPGNTCDEGNTVCADTGDCTAGFYCQLGCCIPPLVR